jgi:hypothetical protein
MRCYIWGTNNHEDRSMEGMGVACFAIPDWGLQFRAAQDGNASVCETAALLALLRFAEGNPKVFEGHNLEIYSDSSQFVEQLTGQASVDPTLVKSHLLIRSLREKIRFELSWIPSDQNRAIEGILDLPPLKTHFQIQHSSPQATSPTAPSRRLKP